MCCLTIAALWVTASPTRPVMAADPPTLASPDKVVNAIRELAYFEYARGVRWDTEEETRLKDRLRESLGNKPDRFLIDQLFDAHDEQALAETWAKLRTYLPDGVDWYVSATVDPLPPTPRDRLVTVVCGCVTHREERTVKLDGKPTTVSVVFLAPGYVKSRKWYTADDGYVDVVAPSDVILDQERLNKVVADAVRVRADLTGEYLDALRGEVLGSDAAERPWAGVRAYLGDRRLMRTPATAFRAMLIDQSVAGGAGRLEALRDFDFVFALTRVGFSDDQQRDLLRARGNLAVARDATIPELGIVAMANGVTRADGEQHTPSDALAAKVNRLLLDYLGSTLAGTRPDGGDPRPYALRDTFLAEPLDPDVVRAAASKCYPHACAALNLRLFWWGQKSQVHITPEDLEPVHGLVERSLAAHPASELVRAMAGSAFCDSGRVGRGEEMLRDVSTHGRSDIAVAAADQELGKLAVRAGRYPEAVQLLTTAERRMSNDSACLYWLFKAYTGAGMPAEAAVVRDRYLNQEPTGPWADELRQDGKDK